MSYDPDIPIDEQHRAMDAALKEHRRRQDEEIRKAQDEALMQEDKEFLGRAERVAAMSRCRGPFGSWKNLSPKRVSVRRRKNKAARKARRRNRSNNHGKH